MTKRYIFPETGITRCEEIIDFVEYDNGVMVMLSKDPHLLDIHTEIFTDHQLGMVTATSFKIPWKQIGGRL